MVHKLSALVVAAALALPTVTRAGDLPPLPDSTAVMPVPAGHNFWDAQVGGTWVSQEFPDKNGRLLRQEMTFTWLDGKHGILGNLSLYAGATQISHETEVLAVNPVDMKYYVLSSDSAGDVKQSRATVKDGVMIADATCSFATGAQVLLRNRIWMPSTDRIEVELYLSNVGSSRLVQRLHFTRKPGS